MNDLLGNLLEPLAREVGQTVRFALQSWPTTERLCVLLVVITTMAAVWTHFHM